MIPNKFPSQKVEVSTLIVTYTTIVAKEMISGAQIVQPDSIVQIVQPDSIPTTDPNFTKLVT